MELYVFELYLYFIDCFSFAHAANSTVSFRAPHESWNRHIVLDNPAEFPVLIRIFKL
jgi:hypothetical protein